MYQFYVKSICSQQLPLRTLSKLGEEIEAIRKSISLKILQKRDCHPNINNMEERQDERTSAEENVRYKSIYEYVLLIYSYM